MSVENAYLARLAEERVRAWERAKEIMEGAASESRDLTAEEDANLAAINADLDSRDARIKELMGAEERAKVADEQREKIAGLFTSAPERATAEPDQSTILRTMLRNKSGEATFSYDLRALANFSTALVPTLFADRIIVYARTTNPILQTSTVIQSTSAEPITFPRITADPTTYTPGEGTAITPADPTFGTATLTVVSYKSLTLVSQELAQDESYGVEDYIARSAGRALGYDSGAAMSTAATIGLVSAATNGGTAVGTPFVSTDLVTLQYSLPSPYRAAGSWMMSNSAIQAIRKFTDSTGQWLWGPTLTPGQPDTLLGKPVYENPSMAAASSPNRAIVFGDLSAFMVKMLPLRVEVSRDYLFNTDQIAIKAVLRAGGVLPDTAAIAALICH